MQIFNAKTVENNFDSCQIRMINKCTVGVYVLIWIILPVFHAESPVVSFYVIFKPKIVKTVKFDEIGRVPFRGSNSDWSCGLKTWKKLVNPKFKLLSYIWGCFAIFQLRSKFRPVKRHIDNCQILNFKVQAGFAVFVVWF